MAGRRPSPAAALAESLAEQMQLLGLHLQFVRFVVEGQTGPPGPADGPARGRSAPTGSPELPEGETDH